MESLDYEGFYLPDAGSFKCLMSIYKLACQDPFPLHSICGEVWSNAEGQLSFLKHAVSSSAEEADFFHSARQLELPDSIQGLKLETRQSDHVWFFVDLLDVLCRIAERGYRDSVQSILDYPLKYCPEVLLLGLAQIKTPDNLVQDELSVIILPRVICRTSTYRNDIILQFWCFNKSLLVRSFVDALTIDADNIARIVDICNEKKILLVVMKKMPFYEAILLATHASTLGQLDLHGWLTANLRTDRRAAFYEECLKYMEVIQFGTSQQDHSGVSVSIHSQEATVFSKVIAENTHLLISGHDDVESEAKSYSDRILSEELAISEMVEMLSRFKDSPDPRDKSVFECVVNNLFEDYKSISGYPKKALGRAAVLFGSVIKNQLVTDAALGIAFGYVLDALCKPAGSNMYDFGTMALGQFINPLDEWPDFCKLIISHLRGTHPGLVTYIEEVLTRRSHRNFPSEVTGSNGGQSREHVSLRDGSSTSANGVIP